MFKWIWNGQCYCAEHNTTIRADKNGDVYGGGIAGGQLQCGSDPSLDDLGSKTVALWLTVNVHADWSAIIWKQGATGWHVYQGSLEKRIDTKIKCTGNNILPQWKNAYVLGTRAHIIFTYDGSLNAAGCKLYKNNSLVTQTQTQDGTGSVQSDAANDFKVGGSNYTINDVYIFDRVITASERALLYNSKIKGIGLQFAGCRGYWPTNDEPDGVGCDGATFLDLSSYGNHATAISGTAKAEDILSYQPRIIYTPVKVVLVAWPIPRLRKDVISGYHCFMQQYMNAKRGGWNPLKLPDGTVF